MMCSGDREKGDVAMEEKWDYVVCLPDKISNCMGNVVLIGLEFG